jgi:DNA polymerase elongation subunit (family B)
MTTKFYTYVALSKNDILLRGYENGKRIQEQIPYKPYLFVPTPTQTKYKTLEGKGVGRVDFDSIRDARNFIQENKEVANRAVYGLNNFVYTFIYDYYRGEVEYDPSLISVCSIDIEVDISDEKGFPDIQAAANEITLITISRKGRKAVFGCGEFVNTKPDVTYHKCNDEVALLQSFIKTWNSDDYSPDIVTGWNVEFFDIPYIVNRIIRVLGMSQARKLSPWNFLNERQVPRLGGREGEMNQVWDPVGVTVLDYMQLYKRFGNSIQESYSLDHIASVVLGERKLDYGEYGSLANLQVKNWQMYTEYNIRDVELVERIDEKLKLIELVYAMAYDAKVNYQDTFTTVRAWDVIIHNYLMDQDIVVHQLKVAEDDRGILGGYVKDPQVGMHKWVVSLDLNSLYPHIIMQYNISPETFNGWLDGVDDCWEKEEAERRLIRILEGGIKHNQDTLVKNNITVAANLTTFRRDKTGFLPALMAKYYDERVVYKEKMIAAGKAYETAMGEEKERLGKDRARFNNFQMAKKLQLNSVYGALANKYFRWYRNEFAEAITSSGQLATRWIERKLNTYLNKTFKTEDVDYVIACDTDSVYIKAENFIALAGKYVPMTRDEEVAYLDKVCVKVLEPYINKCYEELREYVNGVDQKMRMKRECIADKGIWTAKKRYILNVFNQEGVAYAKPKLKMMGIEAIRTSTPQVCRDAIKRALEVIMNGSELDLQLYIQQFRDDFSTMTFNQVASPRSVKDLDKYADRSSIFRKGTPINVRGSLVYNFHLKKLNLDKKYEAINSGQKIKYAYCITPNPLHTSVIACPAELPKEFGMDMYIDRNMQFDKAFLEPIKTITGAIGWEIERRATLEDFFN